MEDGRNAFFYRDVGLDWNIKGKRIYGRAGKDMGVMVFVIDLESEQNSSWGHLSISQIYTAQR